jgi:hypothetical protein
MALRPAPTVPSLRESPIRWLFTDRSTGRIVVAQPPNLSLSGFLVSAVAERVLDGSAGEIAGVARLGFLVWWAGDELLRGVNPFRRVLGAVVLASAVASTWS